MSRLRYALVGCGRRGQAHAATVAQMRGTYEAVAVCDADRASAERAAAFLGVPCFTDLRDMIEHIRVDVCDVVVPNELHHAVSVYLSQQGIHQNMETPLAPTLGLMDSMIESARLHGVVLQTAENFPFLPVEQMVVKLIRAGAIGRVWKCYRLFPVIWYHGLAAIRCRMGSRPLAVSSIGHTMSVVPYVDSVGRDFATEELEFYAVDFENGGLAIAMSGNKNSALGRNRLIGFETDGERGTIITNGNQGVVGGETVNTCTDEDIVDRAGRAGTYEFRREHDSAGVLRRIWVDLPASLGGQIEWRNPYPDAKLEEPQIAVATLLDALARSVTESTAPAWSGEDGRLDREMMLAAGRSIRANRQPVSLPLAVEPDEEAAFERDFSARFGIHPREIPEKVIGVSFKAR